MTTTIIQECNYLRFTANHRKCATVRKVTISQKQHEVKTFVIFFQEMAYFDDPLHSTGALTTALSTHASAVQGVSITTVKTCGGSVLH